MTLEDLADAAKRIDIRDDAWKKAIADTIYFNICYIDYKDPDMWLKILIEDLRETAKEFIYE